MQRIPPRLTFNVLPMKIPNEQDWGDWKPDLDRSYAHKIFFGKSKSEAIELFVENAISHQEDLMWMTRIPFQFYIHAYKEYILSDRSKEDSDGASCYLRLIKYKLEEEPDQITEIFNDILPSLEIVASRQEFYDADIDIYGDFKELLIDIKQRYKANKMNI
jgi:hypothetical protein